MSLSGPWRHRSPAKGAIMNRVEIKEAVEAIQWQAQGMMKVLEETVLSLDGERWCTLSAGLSLIALAAGKVHAELDAPENNPQ